MQMPHRNIEYVRRAKLNDNARELRRQLTPAESQLWLRPRGDKVAGLRFRRQHRVEHFIVDFYCPAVRVAVETDCVSHDDHVQKDAERAARLSALGVRVIRFMNQTVARDLEAVVRAIAKFCGVPL